MASEVRERAHSQEPSLALHRPYLPATEGASRAKTSPLEFAVPKGPKNSDYLTTAPRQETTTRHEARHLLIPILTLECASDCDWPVIGLASSAENTENNENTLLGTTTSPTRSHSTASSSSHNSSPLSSLPSSTSHALLPPPTDGGDDELPTKPNTKPETSEAALQSDLGTDLGTRPEACKSEAAKAPSSETASAQLGTRLLDPELQRQTLSQLLTDDHDKQLHPPMQLPQLHSGQTQNPQHAQFPTNQHRHYQHQYRHNQHSSYTHRSSPHPYSLLASPPSCLRDHLGASRSGSHSQTHSRSHRSCSQRSSSDPGDDGHNRRSPASSGDSQEDDEDDDYTGGESLSSHALAWDQTCLRISYLVSTMVEPRSPTAATMVNSSASMANGMAASLYDLVVNKPATAIESPVAKDNRLVSPYIWPGQSADRKRLKIACIDAWVTETEQIGNDTYCACSADPASNNASSPTSGHPSEHCCTNCGHPPPPRRHVDHGNYGSDEFDASSTTPAPPPGPSGSVSGAGRRKVGFSLLVKFRLRSSDSHSGPEDRWLVWDDRNCKQILRTGPGAAFFMQTRMYHAKPTSSQVQPGPVSANTDASGTNNTTDRTRDAGKQNGVAKQEPADRTRSPATLSNAGNRRMSGSLPFKNNDSPGNLDNLDSLSLSTSTSRSGSHSGVSALKRRHDREVQARLARAQELLSRSTQKPKSQDKNRHG